ncbi:MAG: DNA-3-methyladenine glycosylase family protein [Rhodospirillales bacterium]
MAKQSVSASGLAAAAALRRKCPHMRKALKACGPPPPRRLEAGFGGLCRIIIDQQVSKAAGEAIWRKFEAGVGGAVTPEAVLRRRVATLGKFGLSRAKASYIHGVAKAIDSGELNLKRLARAPDEDVMAALTALKGVGRWTAGIYLMFGLDRPDVFPSGDLALQISAQRLIGLGERPDIKKMDAIAEAWRPHRSTAARLLWMYYRVDDGAADHSPAG